MSALTDLGVERGLLGALIVHPELLPAEGLDATDFAAPAHGAVYAALCRLGPRRPSDRLVSAVVAALAEAGDLALAGGAAGVVSLVMELIPPPLTAQAIERVKMLARARAVAGALRAELATIERDPSQAREVVA